MAIATIVPLAEYLATSYRPDCDYVDGEVRERNVGETDHSRLLARLTTYFGQREAQWGITVLTEQRVQVKPTRFRIPDVLVVEGGVPAEPILRQPPLICIEVLSREDTIRDMQERIDDYLAFGVRYVWVIDPKTRRAFAYTAEGIEEIKNGVLRTQNPDIEIPLADC
jgi:Uma2 family endonuclease